MIDRLNCIVDSFPGRSVLVIGDLMVDEYIWGGVSRISPEAPVPVVLEKQRERRPGGALNVVSNLLSLQVTPYIAGIVGKDDVGLYIHNYVESNDIDRTGLIEISSRPTTKKVRIIGNNQQIVRLDVEDSNKIEETETDRIIDYINSISEKISGIIVSDYNKGVVNKRIMQELEYLHNNRGFFVAVDPVVNHFSFYNNMSLITPNHHEAGSYAGIQIEDNETLNMAAERILQQISPELLLITRGENGMTLCSSDSAYTNVPTVAKHVYDVTGAGDTVITVFTLSMLSNATPLESAILSNIAAGYVVAEVGTTSIPIDILKSRIIPEYIYT